MDALPNAGMARETTAQARGPRRHILEALLSYFMVTLSLGAMLGPIRDFAIHAGSDPFLAILSQAVVTLLILTWAAGWVVEAFDVPPGAMARLAVGLGAVVLLVACDLLIGFLMFDLSPWELVRNLLGPEGAVVAVSLAAAALLPVVRARHGQV